jgi:hypothetical protein
MFCGGNPTADFFPLHSNQQHSFSIQVSVTSFGAVPACGKNGRKHEIPFLRSSFGCELFCELQRGKRRRRMRPRLASRSVWRMSAQSPRRRR